MALSKKLKVEKYQISFSELNKQDQGPTAGPDIIREGGIYPQELHWHQGMGCNRYKFYKNHVTVGARFLL